MEEINKQKSNDPKIKPSKFQPTKLLEPLKKIGRVKLISALAIVVVLIVAISVYLLAKKPSEEGGETVSEGTETETSSKTFEQSSVATELEAEVLNAGEGSYQTFEVIDGEPQRVEKKYYKVYTKVFNPSNEENVVISDIKLADDLGNEYLPDISILFDVRSGPAGFKEFGMDMVIYKRVIREGNIVFPAVAEGAKKLKLILKIEGGKDIVFEFDK